MAVYLDYNATTPVHADVADVIDHHLRETWGNPSSTHAAGRAAKTIIDTARQQVASLIGAEPDEIVFTSGGTEASNLAIRGVFSEDRPVIVTSAIEHPATMQVCRYLERARGATVRVLPVDEFGTVVGEATELVGCHLLTVMHSNNEVGTLQPLADLARAAKAAGAVVHTDAAQSVGKVAVDVGELGVDLLTIAGHKLYAPKGVGALFVARGITIEPVLRGAGHERGIRPGTENVPYIAGLGAACELAEKRLQESQRIRALRDRLWDGIQELFPDAKLNGHPERRLPNTLNVSFPFDARAAFGAVPDLQISYGSACHDDVVEPSTVLRAMGQDRARALGAVRFSLGHPTNAADIDETLRVLGRLSASET